MSYNPEEALQLGGVGEELLELLRGEFQEDEYMREMLRLQAQQANLLRQIARNTGNVPDEIELVGGGDDNGGNSTPGGDTPSGPEYWTTEEDIVVQSQQWESEDWGFLARTVVLLFDTEIEVAFLNPRENDNVAIGLDPGQSPFNIAGVDGLYAPRVWYRQPESVTSEFDLDIIAVQ